MNNRRTDLVRLLAELDQQLADAENRQAVTLTRFDRTLGAEVIEGLRAALENVELQLERNRLSEAHR